MSMKFSEKEKEIIRKIVNYDWTTFCTLDRFIGKELKFELIIKPSQKWYWLYYDVDEGLKGKQKRLNDFFELYFLIKRLIKNDLIIIANGINIDRFVGPQNITEKSGIYGKFDDGSFIDADGKWKDQNKKVIKDIISFPETTFPLGEIVCGVPLISQELRELVKNDFYTDDEKVLRWTRISAAVAFAGLILAIVIPLCTCTKIDEKQIQRMEQVIQESNQHKGNTVTLNGEKIDTTSKFITK